MNERQYNEIYDEIINGFQKSVVNADKVRKGIFEFTETTDDRFNCLGNSLFNDFKFLDVRTENESTIIKERITNPQSIYDSTQSEAVKSKDKLFTRKLFLTDGYSKALNTSLGKYGQTFLTGKLDGKKLDTLVKNNPQTDIFGMHESNNSNILLMNQQIVEIADEFDIKL